MNKEEIIAILGKNCPDFYCCNKCGASMTAIEISEKLKFHPPDGEDHPGLCRKCSSFQIRPMNPTWKQWFRPHVWKFAWLRYRGIA